MNLMLTTNKKPTIDTHTKKKGGGERERKGEWNPNIILKKIIKTQRKMLKKEKNREELQKQPEN